MTIRMTIDLPAQTTTPALLDGYEAHSGLYYEAAILSISPGEVRVIEGSRHVRGASEAEWHGRIRVCTLVSGGCHGRLYWPARIAEAFAPGAELAELAQRVAEGLTEARDGSNRVGTLTDDARAALEAIEDWVAEYGRYLVAEGWTHSDVGDWLDEDAVRADMTDGALDEWVQEAEQAAKADQVLLDGPVLDWAEKVRDEKREAIRDRLIEEAGEEPAFWPDDEDLYENDGGWLEWLPTAQAWLHCSGQPTSPISLLYGSPGDGYEWQGTGLQFANFSCRWGGMVEHFDGEGSDD